MELTNSSTKDLGQSSLRRAWRLVLVVVVTIVMVIPFLVLRALRLPLHRKIPHWYHGLLCRALGINIEYTGEMTKAAPALYVSNHISYLDIPILGLIPGSFMAKSDIAGWPLISTLAKFQNTVFIERRPGAAKEQLSQMCQLLAEDQRLILFAEGTSTDGLDVLPFKSSLFEAANPREGQPYRQEVAIQPVSIAYTGYRGEPLCEHARYNFAWYLEEQIFGSHAFTMLTMPNLSVSVHFHKPVVLSDFESRKACADYCHQQVKQWVAETNQKAFN